MYNQHPWPLKKSKSWGPFWSYQLNSSANPAHLPQIRQCCLAGSSKTAPRILIFSTAMGADFSLYVKSIAIYGPAFFGYDNSVLASVNRIEELTVLILHTLLALVRLMSRSFRDTHKNNTSHRIRRQ